MKWILYFFIIIGFGIGYGVFHIIDSPFASGVIGGSFFSLVIGLLVKSKKEKITMEEYEDELSKHLKNTASYSAHLSNVISGINHEVQPWIGGIQNIIARIEYQHQENPEEAHNKLIRKIGNIKYSCEQTRNLLQLLSTNIKTINQYNTENSNLAQTLESWVNITLMDRFIKDLVDESNFYVDKESLNWTTTHSPMLLAQVILNLVKNSVEHNPDMLDDLKIVFNGDDKKNQLTYKDNGKGIPPEIKDKIFEAGITTKFNKKQHGFGLALCSEYCLSMGAILETKQVEKGACFVITFEQQNNPNYKKKVEEVGHSSGMQNVVDVDQRTIKPAIKGDSTYAEHGDVSDLSEGDKS